MSWAAAIIATILGISNARDAANAVQQNSGAYAAAVTALGLLSVFIHGLILGVRDKPTITPPSA